MTDDIVECGAELPIPMFTSIMLALTSSRGRLSTLSKLWSSRLNASGTLIRVNFSDTVDKHEET